MIGHPIVTPHFDLHTLSASFHHMSSLSVTNQIAEITKGLKYTMYIKLGHC